MCDLLANNKQVKLKNTRFVSRKIQPRVRRKLLQPIGVVTTSNLTGPKLVALLGRH